jgi:flagellin
MPILINDTVSTNVSILQRLSESFQTTQKRVASGKRIFGSADDPSLYKSSENLLGRSRQLSDINNNISVTLATLESTDNTLKNMVELVESALTLVRRAQSEGGVGQRSSTTTANVDSTTVVTGITIGSRFSITTDDGKNFTYTFNSLTTTWGDVANALNASNIGIIAEFIPSTVAGQTNLRFNSYQNKDFTFDAVSDQNAMDDLTGMTTPTGQVLNFNNLFANGLAAPAAGETGFTVAYGGHITGLAGGGVTPATPIAAGSTLTFVDGNGNFRSLSYGGATTLAQVITDVTALGAGIKAELVNQSGGAGGPLQFRMRNIRGGDMAFVSATGDFALGGSLGLNGAQTGFAASLSSNNALRLAYGQQYDAIIANLDLMAQRNPVPNGRNLLQGQNLNVMMDEFAGNPLTISGVMITAAGALTMTQPGASWSNELNIETSGDQATTALINLRGFMAQFATFTNYIRERYDLNRSYLGDLKTQGDGLVAADVSEESAALVALQTRQQFAVQALSIGNQNDQSLLRLLGS